jgi:hypothetical protein
MMTFGDRNAIVSNDYFPFLFLNMCLATASNEIQSKSFKEIYMDWVYGKYLRSQELQKVNDRYKKTKKHIPCLSNICRCSSEYFLRPKDKVRVLSIPGFVEHPNSSLDMYV